MMVTEPAKQTGKPGFLNHPVINRRVPWTFEFLLQIRDTTDKKISRLHY